MKKIVFPLIIGGIGIATLVTGIVASNINNDIEFKQIIPFVKLQNITKMFLFPNEIKELIKEINIEINKPNYNLYYLLKNKTKIDFPKLEDNLKYSIVINENKTKITTEDNQKSIHLKQNIWLIVKIRNTKTNENIKFLQKKFKFTKEELKLNLRFTSPFSLEGTMNQINSITSPTTEKTKLFTIQNAITRNIEKRTIFFSTPIAVPKTISSLSIDSITLKNKETNKPSLIKPSIFEIKTIDVSTNYTNFDKNKFNDDKYISKGGGGLISLKAGNILARGEYKIKISMIVEKIKYTGDFEWLVQGVKIDEPLNQKQLNDVIIKTNKTLNQNIFELVLQELKNQGEKLTKQKIKEYFENPFNWSIIDQFLKANTLFKKIKIKTNKIVVNQDERNVKITYGLATLDKNNRWIHNLKNSPITIPFLPSIE